MSFLLSVYTSILVALATVTLTFIMPKFWRKSWDPKGLHCYVTGGSAGLGYATAIQLTKAGAHVSIVARNEDRLRTALQGLEAARVSPTQILASYSYSLLSAATSSAALEAACVPHGGRAPDAVFACAGVSRPKFFIEMSAEEMSKGMDDTFWVQAWTAFAATKKMVFDGVKGRIVFVSSTVGYMTFAGYSSYSPGKHAIRGLADTLDSELALYDISIHCFFAPTMKTPGLEAENINKPKVTSEIEDGGELLTAEQAAKALLRGVRKDQCHISADLITSIFRASTRGSAPYHNLFVDAILGTIGWIGVPIWRWTADATIRKHKKEHLEHLVATGLINVSSTGK